MAKLRVTNDFFDRRLLFIEPYAGEYWLRKGDEFVVHAVEPDVDEPFSVHFVEEGIDVWINAGEGHVTDSRGVELRSGHQRPDE